MVMRYKLAESAFTALLNFQHALNKCLKIFPGFCKFFNSENPYSAFEPNVIKDSQWYAVQVSDTTMMPIAASLFGQ